MKKFADDKGLQGLAAGSMSQTDAISKRMRMNAMVVGLPDPSTAHIILTLMIRLYPRTIITTSA